MQVFGSPFEADAQVSHLVRVGLADAAATSDSDLLTFGCPLTLYGHLMGGRKPGAMVKWGTTCSKRINELTVEELVSVTCLTGCDYINRLKGMSLKQSIDIVISWRGKVCVRESVTCHDLFEMHVVVV